MRKPVQALAMAAAAASALTYVRYRRDIADIRAAALRGGTIAATAAGPVEYAEAGQGAPLLLIHGAGGGYDQGLLIGRMFGEGYHIIAPSRFGYLRTPAPEDASLVAQAEAHAALLDHLAIGEAIVVGVSAGAPSAIELALRHPDRVSALILLVPRTYDPSQSVGVDDSASSQVVLRLIEASSDFLFWLGTKVARGSVIRFLGVRPELEASASDAERARVTEVMRSILPLSERVGGLALDSRLELSAWPLEEMRVPVLIVSAKDDLFKTLPGARFTAEHIPDAEMRILESGGHLMVGQGAQVKAWTEDFLRRRLS
ncbi:alpha/beta fold hydrolase [Sphingosinicella humi]|uniref:alpha/beta fold hydrolase n=1 Tax=Allosphingosinicella humi TaxID=2068657 RepID=UPI001304A51D|nr:alpha/beta hydrolase [Sphingosinicella humi]